jgi:hypothetical protein
MSDLLPEIPEEIRAARIGTCYDPITRKLITNKNVINPERLASNAIMMVNGKGELKLRANASAEKNATETFFAVDSKAKFGSWGSLGLNMASSSSMANSTSSLNCYCSYVYSGQSLKLMDNGPKALFSYMTEEFQDAYIKLINTAPDNYLSEYFSFIQKFGYGCVTELFLTSGSAFMMTAKYSDEASAGKSKYGASIGIGTPWGGGSVAAEYAGSVASADSKAAVELTAVQIPENTPTKEWCANLMSNVIKLGFDKLAKDASIIEPPKGEGPKAPEIPSGKPSEKKLPEDKPKDDISENIKKQLMKG